MYYQLKFIRCPELDLLFLAVVGYCCYIILPFKKKVEEEISETQEADKPTSPVSTPTETVKAEELDRPAKVEKPAEEVKTGEIAKAVEEIKPVEEDKQVSHKYSADFMRLVKCNMKLEEEEEKKSYSISVSERTYTRRSPSPYRTERSPDPRNIFNRHTPEPNYVSRSPRGRLDADEERNFITNMRELTPDYCPEIEKDLPKDVKTGRVHWLRQRDGRIHMLEPINDIRDIFFHFRDCELEPGDKINLGDSVMFELDMFEGRLCAVKVKKLSIKAIPSPDFDLPGRMKSKEDLPKIEDLEL